MTDTYHDRLVAGLEAMGFRRDTNERTGRYSAYYNLAKPEVKIYVGPNGALRKGPCVARSYSIGQPTRQTGMYKTLLAAGEGRPT